jgi:hypothetical protein
MTGVLHWVGSVPFGDTGRVSGCQHVMVDHVQREAAVDGDAAAFVLVACQIGRQMRHYIPNIHDPIADGIEEAHEIVMAHARLGPGVDDWGKGGNVIQQVRSEQGRTERRRSCVR